MSFNLTSGIFMELVQLATKVRKDFIGAPGQFKALSDEVRSLSIIIQDVDVALSEWDVCEQDQEHIHCVLKGCRSVLSDLSKAREKYTGIENDGGVLGARVKRVWKKINWEPSDIDGLRRRLTSNMAMLNSSLGRLTSEIAIDTKKGVDRLNQRQNAREQRYVLDWLSSTDYSEQQHDYFRRRQNGTGQWLLNSSEYRAWLREPGQTLFCHGIPGAGKTILSSTIVNNIRAIRRIDSSIGLAYIYCNFRHQNEQTLAHILSSLLRQLVESEPQPGKTMADLSSKYNNEREHTQIDINDIITYLRSVSGLYSRAFVVIDALDELSTSDWRVEDLLSHLSRLQNDFRVNILVTSRSTHGIEKMSNSTLLQIFAHDADVQCFAFNELSRHRIFAACQPDMQQDIISRIIRAAGGMFLLAQLHVDSLKEKRSKKALLVESYSFVTGSEAYDKAYDGAMERISGQSRDAEELAKHALLWITFARPPITTSELQHALAVEVGESRFDEENMSEIEDMVSVCAGLVTVDTKSNTIRPAHYTSQDYLEKTIDRLLPDARTEIATVCLSYLSLEAFRDGPCRTSADLDGRLRSYPFYAHAARNWGYYVRDASNSAVSALVLDFAASDQLVQASAQVLFRNYSNPSPGSHTKSITTWVSVLHLMIHFKLDELFQALLPQCSDRDKKDFAGRTPLSRAAEQGSTNIVQLLLRASGVKPDSRDDKDRTPLSWAAEAGHASVVDLLLSEGVEPDSVDSNGYTPLSYASKRGHETVVRRLLLENVNVHWRCNVFGRKSTSTLYTARINGQEAMTMLFDGSTTASVGDFFHTYAGGHEDCVKVIRLIARMDSSEYERIRSGISPLLISTDPTLGRVELFLVRGNDNSTVHGKTPLHLAAWQGHTNVVQLLLGIGGATPHSRDECNDTPLISAVAAGHRDVVKLLLSTAEVDAQAVDAQGMTALSWATKYGYQDMVELLLRYESETQAALT